ncbi:MAG: hypothetical protein ABIN96_07235 [Rubrivivax sp.]
MQRASSAASEHPHLHGNADIGRAYALYRDGGGANTRPTSDFTIGAHAAVANLSVLTRDPAGYRSDYPKLRVISP